VDESPTISEDSIAVLSYGDYFEDYRIHREGGAEVEEAAW
jgi:hypothetical protein